MSPYKFYVNTKSSICLGQVLSSTLCSFSASFFAQELAFIEVLRTIFPVWPSESKGRLLNAYPQSGSRRILPAPFFSMRASNCYTQGKKLMWYRGVRSSTLTKPSLFLSCSDTAKYTCANCWQIWDGCLGVIFLCAYPRCRWPTWSFACCPLWPPHSTPVSFTRTANANMMY